MSFVFELIYALALSIDHLEPLSSPHQPKKTPPQHNGFPELVRARKWAPAGGEHIRSAATPAACDGETTHPQEQGAGRDRTAAVVPHTTAAADTRKLL